MCYDRDPVYLRELLENEELSWTETTRAAVVLASCSTAWEDMVLCLGVGGYAAEVAAMQIKSRFQCDVVLDMLCSGYEFVRQNSVCCKDNCLYADIEFVEKDTDHKSIKSITVYKIEAK